MTVGAYAKVRQEADGANQTFSFTFEIFSINDVVVTLRDAAGDETTLVKDTHYTVGNLAGSDPWTGGDVVTVATYAAGNFIVITRDQEQIQATDLQEAGVLPADTLENQYDKTVMMIQDLQEQISRCVQIPITDAALTVQTPNSIDRASKTSTYDASGNVTAT